MSRKPKAAPDAPRKSKYPGVYPSGRTSWKFMSAVMEMNPATGEQKRKPVSRGGFRTDLEAWQAKCAFEAERDGLIGTVGRDVTVEQWVELWIDSRVNAKPNTIRGRKAMLNLYIAPHLGRIPLRELTTTHVDAWIRLLLTSPSRRYADRKAKTRRTLSPSTVRIARVLLSSALKAAADQGYIVRNVAATSVQPAWPKRADLGWTAKHAQTFLAAVEGNDLEALWKLALLAQMRPGELTALQWDDVDLRAGTITIRRSATIDEGGHVVSGSPKTSRSAATIDLPSACVAALRQHAAQNRLRRVSLDAPPLVFPGRFGGLLSNATLGRRLRDLCTASKLPEVKPHGLRHIGATLAIRAGVDPAIVSRRLRHHSVAFTLDTYVETSLDDLRKGSDTLEQYLREATS